MAIAAFLASDTTQFLRDGISAAEIHFARSWKDLESQIQRPRVDLVLLDPCADGALRIPAVTEVLNRYPTIPVAAYCTLRYENFHALLTLYQRGLAHVFLHPLRDNGKSLLEMSRRLGARRLAYQFLATIETRLVTLEPRLLCAVLDLFERPHRYETGADIGRQCQLHPRYVYRALQKANIGTPKKLVTVAKVLHAFSYLSQSTESVASISKTLGYSRPQLFSVQVTETLGCSASKLRRDANVLEIETQLIEWLYRPPRWG